jgi:hypothetical protein
MMMNWDWEVRSARARRRRKAFDELVASAGPHLSIENDLLFGALAQRARKAAAETKKYRNGRRILLRVNTQRRAVLTADGRPVPGISYDQLTQVLLARERRR